MQWLRLYAPSAGDLGSILGRGTRSHMLQIRVCMLELKIPPATAETWCITQKKLEAPLSVWILKLCFSLRADNHDLYTCVLKY